MKPANFGYFSRFVRWGMPLISFCFIAYLNIQYFLYFGGNEQVLGWYGLRGCKWSRRHGELRTFPVSHAGRPAGLRRNIPDNPAEC